MNLRLGEGENAMNEIRINSWNELQEALFEDAWNPEIERYRSRNAFRGLSDVEYPLETTLMRLGGRYVELERHLLRGQLEEIDRPFMDQGAGLSV